MGLGLEVEVGRLAPGALHPVGALVGALRHRLVAQVGEGELGRGHLLVDRRDFLLELLDLALELGDRRDLGRGVAAAALDASDLLRGLVAPTFPVFELDEALAPLGVAALPAFERPGLDAPRGEAPLAAAGIVSEDLARQHGARSLAMAAAWVNPCRRLSELQE